ncbi:MAG: YveK family protein [Brotaphodocola sp.]
MEKEQLMNEENDELEIDLLELFRALKKRIWMILAAAVVAGGIAGAFSKFVLIPQYESTSMVYILSKETTLTSLADLQIGSQLTQDYKIIVTSRPVLEDVIGQLNLELEYEELKQKITINNPKDTRILSITAQDPDPMMAKKITDAVAKTSSEYIGDIMEMVPPKIIEKGVVAMKKSSPSNTKNALIGAVLGMMAVCGITILEVILNDTVRTEEDIAKYLGISVLASVPARASEFSDEGSVIHKKGAKKESGKKSRKKKGGRS